MKHFCSELFRKVGIVALAMLCFAAHDSIAQQPVAPAAAQPERLNKTAAMAEVMNQYTDTQLLLSLMVASPFANDRTSDELIAFVGAIPEAQRNDLKKEWFVFLLNRFSQNEIRQMRVWQEGSPQGQSLLLKMLAQAGLSNPEMLGKMMGIIPNNIVPQGR